VGAGSSQACFRIFQQARGRGYLSSYCCRTSQRRPIPRRRVRRLPLLSALILTTPAHRILPQLVKKTSVFPFCLAFVKSLYEHKKSILERLQSIPSEIPEDTSKDGEAFDHLVYQCLNTPVMQWDCVVAQPAAHAYYDNRSQPQQSRITRVIDLVEVSHPTGHMAPCKKLFVLLFKIQGPTEQKFQTLYSPLIPPLRGLLRTKNVDLCSSPFSDLLQLFVGTYLRDILGAQPRNIRTKARKIGCGCGDCNAVNNFLSSTTSMQQIFRYAQTRRVHVERHLSAASDLVTFLTIRSGSPHGIQVTKRPKIVAALQWDTRVAQTKTFLGSIGDDDALSKLMRNRYGDVMKALQGSQQFTLMVGDAATVTNTTAPLSIIFTHTVGPAGKRSCKFQYDDSRLFSNRCAHGWQEKEEGSTYQRSHYRLYGR
jgi:hypothetical protein